MTEDSDSYLAEDQIDRQLRKPEATGDRYTRKQSGEPGMYKRILEGLIVIAVVALVGAVWNLTQTATLLQTSQDAFEKSTRRDIDRIERRQDTLEGKLTRGDAGALDQQ